MWIVSPACGLLSIVLADDPKTGLPATDLMMIRARSRAHLALLMRQHPILADIVRSITDRKSKPLIMPSR